MRRIYCIGIAVLISVVAIAVLVWRPREPDYQGRNLSSWLRQGTEPPRHVKKIAEARMAIQAMSAERVVPELLRLVRSSDRQRSVRSLVLDLAHRFNIYVGPLYQSDDPSDMAAAGFQALGTNAAFAVPALAEIAKQPPHTMIAFRCLASIGSPARDVITQALTNSDAKIRSFAVSSLSEVVDQPSQALNLVKDRLTDPDPEVRTRAIQVLGTRLRTEPQSLPLLIEVVRRADTNDATIAATEIANFTTNGIAAFETLSNAAYQSPHTYLALASLRSMLQIAPERTLPILSHRLHSVDPWLRSQSLMLLVREYPKPEVVIPAVEYAAQDPEEIIASRAENFLQSMYAKSPPTH